MKGALIIGGGPAGLMAADMISAAGHPVVVAEAKPSVARKFLMAGKSGLNLTKSEPFEPFLKNFSEAAPHLRPMLEAFGPQEAIAWAEALGQVMFTGSTGRVFSTTRTSPPAMGRHPAASVTSSATSTTSPGIWAIQTPASSRIRTRGSREVRPEASTR